MSDEKDLYLNNTPSEEDDMDGDENETVDDDNDDDEYVDGDNE